MNPCCYKTQLIPGTDFYFFFARHKCYCVQISSYVLKTTTNTLQYLVLTVDMSQLMFTSASIHKTNAKLHLNCDMIVIVLVFLALIIFQYTVHV